MTDLEQEQIAQSMAREIVQKAEQSRREAIDVVSRTLFSAGIVFLALVVPLFYNQNEVAESVRLCFLASVVQMFVALLNSGLLLFRANRVAKDVIDHMRPVVLNGMWLEYEAPMFRWWEIVEMVVMCLSFIGSVVTLIVAMFLK